MSNQTKGPKVFEDKQIDGRLVFNFNDGREVEVGTIKLDEGKEADGQLTVSINIDEDGYVFKSPEDENTMTLKVVRLK